VYTVAAARAGFKGGGREPGLCGAAHGPPNTDRQRPIREHAMSARFDRYRTKLCYHQALTNSKPPDFEAMWQIFSDIPAGDLWTVGIYIID
jgi:hypothetical protein